MNVPSTDHKALIFGATGYTGSALIRQLAVQGIPTFAHIRPQSSKHEELNLLCETHAARVCEAVWEDTAIEQLVDTVAPTLVFGVLGTTRARMKSLKREGKDPGMASYETVDYGLTSMAFRACSSMGNRLRFVYLSSMGVREGGRLPYLAVRWKMEEEIRSGPCDWTIVRPGFITGADRDEFRLGERIGALVSDGFLAVAGALGGRRLTRQYRSLSADELAGGLIRCALSEEARFKVLTTLDLRGGP